MRIVLDTNVLISGIFILRPTMPNPAGIIIGEEILF